MRRPYRCHLDPQSVAGDSFNASGDSGAHRRDPAEIVGVARCPCCRAPLVARMGRRGPYFHCRCRSGEDASPVRV